MLQIYLNLPCVIWCSFELVQLWMDLYCVSDGGGRHFWSGLTIVPPLPQKHKVNPFKVEPIQMRIKNTRKIHSKLKSIQMGIKKHKVNPSKAESIMRGNTRENSPNKFEAISLITNSLVNWVASCAFNSLRANTKFDKHFYLYLPCVFCAYSTLDGFTLCFLMSIWLGSTLNGFTLCFWGRGED